LAKVMGVASLAQAPALFTTAPIAAIKALLGSVGWSAADVGLYEINEAFAVVSMAAMRDLALPAYRVNVHGGACALGHPIGASGAHPRHAAGSHAQVSAKQGHSGALHRRGRGNGGGRQGVASASRAA
jgi:acetyl-CoA acetyltransferase